MLDVPARQILRVNSGYKAPCAEDLMGHSHVLKAKYERTCLLEDVEDRIQALRNVWTVLIGHQPDVTAQPMPDDDSRANFVMESGALVTCLYELSLALGDRYRHTGQPEDLEEQVQLLQLSLGTPPESSNLAILIQCELGGVLRTRFFHVGNYADIQEAFTIHSSLLDRHPEVDSNHARLLYELAHTLLIRNTRSANNEDLPLCVSLIKQALSFISESDPCHWMAQYVLAKALWKGRGDGDVSSLHAAAAIYRDLLRLRPSNHPDRWMIHYSLGTCMGCLYEQTSDTSYLNEGLGCSRLAFDEMDCRNPNRVRTALNIGNFLYLEYERSGEVEHLNESIKVLQSCLGLSYSTRADINLGLSNALVSRYDALGMADDLDESIRIIRWVLETYPPGDNGWSHQANNMATYLLARYHRDKRVGDITEAITLFREALLVAETIRIRSITLLNLADCLMWYHEEYGDGAALEEATTMLSTTWSNRSGAYEEDRGWFLDLHAKVASLRYKYYHDVNDLDTAISRYEEALSYLLGGHTSRPKTLVKLAEVVRLRFEVSHSPEDLKRASALLKEAQVCFPDGHPDRAMPLFNLARLHLCEAAPFFDIRAALDQMSQAISYGNQSARKRLTSALDVLKHLKTHASSFEHSSELRQALLGVYELTIDLLPHVTYFGFDIPSRLRVLGNSDQLATDGASHALVLNRPQFAIELLEQGRAVFWSLHLRLRTPFSALPVDLATKLSQTAFQLERGSHALVVNEEKTVDDDHGKVAHEMETVKQRRLGDDFEALVRQARALPGFERFMLPETFQALSMTASKGPVVVLLVNDVTCQAVVIETPEKVHQVRLPVVSLQRLEALTQSMAMAARHSRTFMRDRAMKKTQVSGDRKAEEVLAELWRSVVQRIVDVLQLKKSTGRSRPRITLCSTSIFAHLPLHAAGLYRKGGPEATNCFSDYAVPSYTPTLGALLSARQRFLSTLTAEAKMLIAAVSEPFKWARLPYVANEVELVRKVIPSQIAVEILGDVQRAGIIPYAAPTTSAVLERLPEATILHLACHGYQDPAHPLESGFIMKDSMLTVSKLMALNLDKAFLAFLSACETAKGDKAHTDQAIHLAAAMLFAGFKSVIATMWSMGDVDGPVIAETVYEELYPAGGAVDPDSVPYTLDRAVQKLRAKGLSASRWAPYVHLGA